MKDLLISTLLLVRDKPAMFMAEGQSAIINFFLGFDLALKVCGYYTLKEDLYFHTLSTRGWGSNTIEAVNKMVDKGLTQEEIARELITIRIIVLNK